MGSSGINAVHGVCKLDLNFSINCYFSLKPELKLNSVKKEILYLS